MRGDICVKVLGNVHYGVNWSIPQVIGFITGAATETGFVGLGQRFIRKINY